MHDSITLKEVFDDLFNQVKFDQKLAKLIKIYQVDFVHRSDDHRHFFGGNLIGDRPVRFTYSDYTRFFEDLLGMDENVVESEIRKCTTIDHSFQISGDPLNLTVLYLVHRFMNSPLLPVEKRIDAARDVMLIFNYRTIAALLARYFKYPIDSETAQAVYERLSGRYLIKKEGTWQKVFLYLVNRFIDKESPHYDTFMKFKNDAGIVNAINDAQGRVKDILKNIYQEFMYVYENKTKIGSGSATMIDADGEEIVKDRVHGLENYQNYLTSLYSDKNSFIKYELIDIVGKVIPTVHGKAFPMILEYMCSELEAKNHEAVLKFSDLCLVLAYNYLLKNSYTLHHSKDLLLLVSKLKGFILSSREESTDLLEFRRLGDSIVSNSVKQTSEQTIAALRNGLFLYVCLRAFTKHAYGG